MAAPRSRHAVRHQHLVFVEEGTAWKMARAETRGPRRALDALKEQVRHRHEHLSYFVGEFMVNRGCRWGLPFLCGKPLCLPENRRLTNLQEEAAK